MKLKKVRQMFAFTLALSMVTPTLAYASPVATAIEVLEDGTQILDDGTKILPDGTHVDGDGNLIVEKPVEPETPVQPEVEEPQTGTEEKPETTTPPTTEENGGTETPDGNGEVVNPEEKPEVPEEKPDGNGETVNPEEKPEEKPEVPEEKPEVPEETPEEKPEEKPEIPLTPLEPATPITPEESPETPAPEQPEKPEENVDKPNISRPRPVIKPQMQEVKDFRFFQIGKNYSFAKEDIVVLEEKADNAEVIGKLPKDGMAFVLKDCKDGWIFVESGDSRGFVKQEKLAMSGEAGTIVEALKKQAQEQTDKENKEIKDEITKEVEADTTKEKGESDEDFKKRVEEKIEEIFNTKKKPLIDWETLRPQAETLVASKDNKNVAFTRATTKNTVVAKSYGLVDATALNVREGKGTDTRIVGLLPSNALMYVLADADQEWVYIESGDVRGFVPVSYTHLTLPTNSRV